MPRRALLLLSPGARRARDASPEAIAERNLARTLGLPGPETSR
jgi:hypothetical protein